MLTNSLQDASAETQNGRAIFVLYTPLHVLIALRIIEDRAIRSFSALYIANDNSVNCHYFSKLKGLAETARHITSDRTGLKVLTHCFFSRELGDDKNIDLYCSNLKKIHSRFAIALINPSRLFSLDDGSGNISGEGYLYDYLDSFPKRFVLSTLFPLKALRYSDLVKRLTRHYTIFSHPNVYESVAQRITLVQGDVIEGAEYKGEKCIYLGNAFTEDKECDERYEKEIYEFINKTFPVDVYLPHPREVRRKSVRISGPKLVDVVDMIAEDYIISEIRKGYRLTVIGAYSTVLLNICNLASVKCINLRVHIRKPTRHLDEIFHNSNIRSVDIEMLS